MALSGVGCHIHKSICLLCWQECDKKIRAHQCHYFTGLEEEKGRGGGEELQGEPSAASESKWQNEGGLQLPSASPGRAEMLSPSSNKETELLLRKGCSAQTKLSLPCRRGKGRTGTDCSFVSVYFSKDSLKKVQTIIFSVAEKYKKGVGV